MLYKQDSCLYPSTKELPIDFKQHFFFYNALFFITEVFEFILECSQVTGNKVEL